MKRSWAFWSTLVLAAATIGCQSTGTHDGAGTGGAGGRGGVTAGAGPTAGSGGNAGGGQARAARRLLTRGHRQPMPAPAEGATGMGGAVVSTGGAGGATTGMASISLTPSWPSAAILTGVRDVVTPAVSQTVELRNDGTTTAMITAVSLAGTNAAAFRVTGFTAPVSLAAGASMPVAVEVSTTGAALPAAPPQNSGGTLLTAVLSATASNGGSAQATVYGLLLTTATHEVTLGQS